MSYSTIICTISKQHDSVINMACLIYWIGCSDDPAREAGTVQKFERSDMNISSNEAYGIAHHNEEAEETIYNYPDSTIEAQQNEAYATSIVTQGNEAYATIYS